jgi:NADH:ubiquinone oxidoreductase subunit 2 (subunit N)
MGNRFGLAGILGIVLMAAGVLLLLSSIPFHVWRAALGLAMLAGGFLLRHSCGNAR